MPESEAALSTFRYETFVSRNAGYVSEALQHRIHSTRLLVAGCGIGSTIAETCLRLGFQHLTLVDKDRVEAHNLNRQNFTAADVGTQKVDALAKRLLAINPAASIRAIDDWVTPENATRIVGDVDVVLDTIDFLSLEGIVALHDAGLAQQKPIIAPLSAGWGAAAFYFPPGATCSFRTIFGLPASGPVAGMSYVDQFMRLIDRVSAELSPDIVLALKATLTQMDDGTPCPAPHVSVGSWAVGSLAAMMAVKFLRGEPMTAAPRLIFLNMDRYTTTTGIDML
jgi:molybdopterin/thiamine biosynthesis adenylyltransferase